MMVDQNVKVTIRSVETSFPPTFEEWLDTNCKMSPINYMETKYDKDKETQKYLSDYLEGKIKLGKKLALNNHDAYHPVFISAPTGAGKNYFLVHNILGPLFIPICHIIYEKIITRGKPNCKTIIPVL